MGISYWQVSRLTTNHARRRQTHQPHAPRSCRINFGLRAPSHMPVATPPKSGSRLLHLAANLAGLHPPASAHPEGPELFRFWTRVIPEVGGPQAANATQKTTFSRFGWFARKESRNRSENIIHRKRTKFCIGTVSNFFLNFFFQKKIDSNQTFFSRISEPLKKR